MFVQFPGHKYVFEAAIGKCIIISTSVSHVWLVNDALVFGSRRFGRYYEAI